MRYMLFRLDRAMLLRRLTAVVVMTAAVSAAAACAASVRTQSALSGEGVISPAVMPVSCADLPAASAEDTDEILTVCGGDGEDEGTVSPDIPAYISLDRLELTEDILPPLESASVSSLFGYRLNPVSGKYAFHSGCDLAAPEGESIRAMMDGRVSLAGWDNGYGNYVIIDHSGGVQTLYAHCSKLLCEKGDGVSQGDVIALVGATGGATGPHLHVEFRRDGKRYDPEWILGGIYA